MVGKKLGYLCLHFLATQTITSVCVAREKMFWGGDCCLVLYFVSFVQYFLCVVWCPYICVYINTNAESFSIMSCTCVVRSCTALCCIQFAVLWHLWLCPPLVNCHCHINWLLLYLLLLATLSRFQIHAMIFNTLGRSIIKFDNGKEASKVYPTLIYGQFSCHLFE